MDMTEWTARTLAALLESGEAYKRFIVCDEAWYGDSVRVGRSKDIAAELSIGVDSVDRGTYGEWLVSWHRLGRHDAAPRLEAFDDSWSALRASGFDAVMASLEGVQNVTPRKLQSALEAFGWKDETARTRPEARTN